LERILSDSLPTGAFETQYQISPGSTERVDAVIKCPHFVLPIDSKFPREQILPLFETDDPVKLDQARKTLFEVMKGLSRSIKDKYIKPEHGTSDLALLFIPSETIYFELIKHGKIAEELSKNKVFAVSPNTLAITVHAISIARSYYDMAQGVEKTLSEVGKDGTEKDITKENIETNKRVCGKIIYATEKMSSTATPATCGYKISNDQNKRIMFRVCKTTSCTFSGKRKERIKITPIIKRAKKTPNKPLVPSATTTRTARVATTPSIHNCNERIRYTNAHAHTPARASATYPRTPLAAIIRTTRKR
jgi:hypothetical protein